MSRVAAAVVMLLAATAVAARAQTERLALDVSLAADGVLHSTPSRASGVWIDAFAAWRVVEGLDFVARPVISRRTFNGRWQKQMYQLGVRYERPGDVGWRVDAGQIISPIGIGLLENRADLNPVVSQHSAYYLPLPTIDPEIPRSFLIAAAYPFGTQVTVASKAWDVRAAVMDSSPVRGRPFFGSNKPPRLFNWVAGAGITPHIGLRLGAAVARGAYASVDEVRDTSTGDRDATMVQVEGEWSFGYTRLVGEMLRSTFETARGDADAIGGWIEVTQTLTPRLFVSGRGDLQRFRAARVTGEFHSLRYERLEAIAGFRLTPELTLRGGYLGRRGYVVSHWDDQWVGSVVWAKKIF